MKLGLLVDPDSAGAELRLDVRGGQGQRQLVPFQHLPGPSRGPDLGLTPREARLQLFLNVPVEESTAEIPVASARNRFSLQAN